MEKDFLKMAEYKEEWQHEKDKDCLHNGTQYR